MVVCHGMLCLQLIGAIVTKFRFDVPISVRKPALILTAAHDATVMNEYANVLAVISDSIVMDRVCLQIAVSLDQFLNIFKCC